MYRNRLWGFYRRTSQSLYMKKWDGVNMLRPLKNGTYWYSYSCFKTNHSDKSCICVKVGEQMHAEIFTFFTCFLLSSCMHVFCKFTSKVLYSLSNDISFRGTSITLVVSNFISFFNILWNLVMILCGINTLTTKCKVVLNWKPSWNVKVFRLVHHFLIFMVRI